MSDDTAWWTRLPGGRWTGGQYSVFRILLGAYLLIHFVHLAPWSAELFSNAGVLPDGSLSPLLRAFPNLLAVNDSPAMVHAMIGLAVAASVCLMLGWRDRLAAILLWYLWACLFGRNPLISNPSLPFIGLLLIVHAMLPAAPFGSLAARGRRDPDGGWTMDPRLFTVVWILMAVGYSYSGYTKLISPSWQDGTALERLIENPLARPGMIRDIASGLPSWMLMALTYAALGAEVLFAPLALHRRTRPWIWGVMFSMHLGLLVLIDFADLSFGMVMVHLFTFDPAWVAPRRPRDPLDGQRSRVLFDGDCGLCHGFVRFLLAEDRAETFVFSPLAGKAACETLTWPQRLALPDSVVVLPGDGRLLVRSDAVRHALDELGGLWRVIAWAMRWVPRPVRDLAYDGVARLRRSFSPSVRSSCPLVPPSLRGRFEA